MQYKKNIKQREALLPPPELLERYDAISPGLTKELVEIIKDEQKHRQSLQKKYLFHYRLGQLFGFGYGIYVIYKIFELAQTGNEKIAYVLAGIFGILTLAILSQYKTDRRSASIRSAQKHRQFHKEPRDFRGHGREHRDRYQRKPYNKRRE